jgi:hypothetical protein
MKILDFNKQQYNFDQIIQEFIESNDLSDLEAERKEEDRKEEDRSEDQNSIYKNMEQTSHYQNLYEKLDGEEGERFYDLYKDFIRQVVRPMYDEPIFYQKKPTHRIHFKNGSGASRFHKDSDYGHNRAEVNYSVPQTAMFGTNGIWIESEEGKADYNPMEMKVGQYAEFKGAYLKHGAKENESGQTRVSFDFRVMPQSEAPDVFTDKSTWKEEDKDNPLFKNAHNFALCE